MMSVHSASLLDRLIASSFERPLPTAMRYFVAAVMIVAVGIARALFLPATLPWLMFIPTAILVTLFTGRRPGLFAAVLSAITGIATLGSAGHPTWVPLQQWVSAGLYLVVMVGIVTLAAALRSSFRRAQQSSEERERFVRLVENSSDFIGMAHLDGKVFFLNNAARQLVGAVAEDASELFITDFFPADHVAEVVQEVLPAAGRDGHWKGELCFRHFETGEHIPVLYSVFPITDEGGKRIGYGTVTRDYRDLKQAETDLRYLNGELAHRLKNVLAVVQSVAQQTLRRAVDLDTASQDLGARLVALAAATDILTANSWRSADLCEVARKALSPHGEIGSRILLAGPTVTLKAEVTVALVLALHELATNAAKYGALSNDAGVVRLSWSVYGEGDEACWRLIWKECGGPPVSAPDHRGFGSTLIDRSLRSYFRGSTAMDYRPEGLIFQLDARLRDAAVAYE